MTGRLALALTARTPDDCPPEVLAKSSLCLEDFLSGAYEAAPLEWSRQAAAIAVPVADGAALIAARSRAAAGDAAFANAVAAHGLVREDMHTGSIAHLGVVIWPALLAALTLSRREVSGRELLAAGVAGYEVGGRIGTALMTAELARLFRPTGMAGPLASASACGLVLGLDEDQLAAALGLAANTAAGFNEWPHSGGSEMYFHAGFAARNGLACALLARQGAFAAPSILEGEAGLFRAIGRTAPPDDIAIFPSGDHAIMDVFHKQAPACNYAQTPIQAALRAFGDLGRAASTVREVRLKTTRAALLYPGCDHTGPFGNILQAKMSIQYGVAAAIASGELAEANYAMIGDPEVGRLIAAVALEEDPALTAAYPGRQGAAATVVAEDGHAVTCELADVIKADGEEIRSRFIASAGNWLGPNRTSDLVEFVHGIESRQDARPVDGLCIPAA